MGYVEKGEEKTEIFTAKKDGNADKKVAWKREKSERLGSLSLTSKKVREEVCV